MAKEKKSATARATGSSDFFQKLDFWLGVNERKVLIISVATCLFLTFISFNARISEAHDDALYLEGGWRYVHEFPKYFYTQNAPLYPMFLGLLISVLGFKLIVFKVFSTLFNVLGLVLFYKALKGRIPAAVLIPLLVFQACNYLIIYYASMTFTEAFYFFLQGLFFYYGVIAVERVQQEGALLKVQVRTWLMLGLSMFLISTAKSSAIVVIPAVLLYFFIEKQWKAMAFSLGAYLVFKIPYEILVKLIWHAQNQFKGQSRILLQKDPYDKSLGEEDLPGFISRYIENCDLSLSKRFYQLIGWKDEFSSDVSGAVTLLTLGLTLFGFWQLLKHKNRSMVLLSFFTGAQLILSFIILQTKWDQPRITLVGMPILLMLIFYGLFTFARQKKLFALYGSLVILVSGSVILSSVKRGVANVPIIKKNLRGDQYFGYTPDWQNFLKCSEWCADSLPDTSLVGSRKAPMSFVYGKGKKFFPIYSVVYRDTATRMSDPDSALAYFRKNKVTHIMLGSLRANPNDPSMGVINTVHHILAPIMDKYPQKLELVHTEGSFEQTEVYKLNY